MLTDFAGVPRQLVALVEILHNEISCGQSLGKEKILFSMVEPWSAARAGAEMWSPKSAAA